MERYISLALLLALLLATCSCPAFADTEGVIIEDIELEAPELRQSDLVELDGIGLLDTDLLTDLVTGEDTFSAGYPDSASDVIQNDSSSNYSLSETSITIGEKEKYTKLTVNATTSNGKSPKITWRSGNKKIAKVNSKTGKITGVKKGSTTIYAKIEGQKKEIKCKVKVLKAPKKKNFSISPQNGSLKVGQIGQYEITFDSGYGGSFTFSSSDTSIASIDENGVVTANSPGTCDITATMYNEVERTVSLQVLSNGSSESEKIEKLLSCARKKLGKPYKHGCFGSDRFDCVGFTYWCYKQVGVKLKDSTSKQAEDTRFMSVSYDELAPGDLVYFHTDDDSDVSHAALYLGDGEIIHASQTAGKVIISEMVSSSSDYYKRNFHCARRVFP